MTTALTTTLLLARVVLAVPAAEQAGPGWPQFLGPSRDGSAAAGGLLEGPVGLSLLWRRPLGSGYSGIAVASGTAVTMHSDGVSDFLAAFDARTGDRRWLLRLADAYQGHDGSEDGPTSTPLILDGRAFALHPKGLLLAASLESGQELWRVSLPETFSAPEPQYGFASSPLGLDGVVVVQVGGPEGRGVCAFDPATGALRWHLGHEPAGYRSPALVEVDGGRQVVSVTARTIRGSAVDGGAVLWEKAFDEDTFEDAAQITPSGNRRFLVTGWNESRMFELTPAGDGWRAAEIWKTPEIKGTFAVPLFHAGYLYGYSGAYLACVDAGTGQRVWKARPPGAGAAIRVDDHLVLWAAGGVIEVARAQPGGYVAAARIEALDEGSVTPPSFADGTLFVRNLKEIAAVSLRRGAASGLPEAAGLPAITAGTEFGRFLAALPPDSADRAAAVGRYLAAQPSIPIVEKDRVVHFVYRGAAADVGISGTLMRLGSEPMRRVEGADVFYRSYRVEPGSRLEYGFAVDFGESQADPANPAAAPGTEGRRSELKLRGWKEPAYVQPPEGGLRGVAEKVAVASAALGETREITVHVPAGHAASVATYPLLLVQDLSGALSHGRFPETVENLVRAQGTEPVIVAFVPFPENWWIEAYEGRRDDRVRFVADEVVPELARRYRVRDGREHRAVAGVGWGAFPALYAALRRPDSFGKVAAISVHSYGPLNEQIAGWAARGGPALEVYLGWGIYDFDPDFAEHVSFPEIHEEMAGILSAAGHRVTRREILAGTGWGSWWAQTGPMLERFFPAVPGR